MKNLTQVQNVQISLCNVLLSVIFAFIITSCSNANQVDQSKADENLILGLIAGNAAGFSSGRSHVTDYNGNWDIGFTFDANGILTGAANGRWILSTNPDGSGTIISSNRTNAFDDTTYRIISFNTSRRQLFYQNTPGTNNFSHSTFGRIDFTPVLSTGCELGATKCFYFCERVFGQATLALAESSNLTSNADAPTAANSCGTLRFSRALYRADNSTWASVQ